MVPRRAGPFLCPSLLVGGGARGVGVVRCLGACWFCWVFWWGASSFLGLGMGALLLWADGRAVGFTLNTLAPFLCCVGVVLGSGSSAGAPLVGGLLVVVVGCL